LLVELFMVDTGDYLPHRPFTCFP